MSEYILTGDPAQHGGSQVDPPVLVYTDGENFVMADLQPGVTVRVFINGKDIDLGDKPLTFASDVEVAAMAAKYPRRCTGVPINTRRDAQGNILSWSKDKLGISIVFSGKLVAIVPPVVGL